MGYFTPYSIVRLIVEILQPYGGRVFGRTRDTLGDATPRFHAFLGDLMTHDPSQSRSVRPFTRQSTVLDLASTLPGRAFKALIVRGLPPTASEKERQELEDLTVGLPLETLVELSEGKLTWGIADSVLDLANRKPQRLVRRGVDAGRGRLQKVTRAVRR